MSSYIDLKYINLLSTRLERFARKHDYLYNFRCPHCGDSQKSKSKARAYFYRVKNDMFFKCHNCGFGQNLANFIKFIDPKLHDEFILERYKGSAPATPTPNFDFKPPKFKEVNIIEELKTIADLNDTHPAKKYIIKRKIPEKFFSSLYFEPNFMKLVNKVKPDTFKNYKGEHPRLIIPFYDTTGELFAFQGRAFGNEQPKYLTIKLDESKQKIFGLERVNFQQPIKIVEGPIDSLFLKNCLAAGGADLKLPNTQSDNVTYVFDNEPRNKEIVKRMYKAIDDGYNVVVWPSDIQLKDVNDIIISGLSIDEVNKIISNNTFKNLEAITKVNNWKRCEV